MNSVPKIMVFKLREIIYTLILAFFIILLIICLILMFTKKNQDNVKLTQKKSGTVLSDTDTAQSGTDLAAQNSTDDTTGGTDTAQSGTDDTPGGTDTAQSGTDDTQSGTDTAQSSTDLTETATVEADASSADGDTYIAGVYTSQITLGDSAVDVQVTVDSDRIRSIELLNLSEATAVAYPLVSSSLENLSAQILEKQKLDGITCSTENRYTSQLLLNAISSALQTALPSSSRSTQTQE